MCCCTHHDYTGGCKLEVVSPKLLNLLIKHLIFFFSYLCFLFFFFVQTQILTGLVVLWHILFSRGQNKGEVGLRVLCISIRNNMSVQEKKVNSIIWR